MYDLNIKDKEKVVLMCHGFTGSKDEIFDIFKNYENHTNKSIARFNYVGNNVEGDEITNYKLSDYHNQIDTIIADLIQKGYKHIDLIGYSMSGYVLTTYPGIKNPAIVKVVLWNPSFRFDLSITRRFEETKKDGEAEINGYRFTQEFVDSFQNKTRAAGDNVTVISGTEDTICIHEEVKEHAKGFGVKFIAIGGNHFFEGEGNYEDLIKYTNEALGE